MSLTIGYARVAAMLGQALGPGACAMCPMALVASRGLLTSSAATSQLPHTRSVEQAPQPGSHPKRSVDAPADPLEKQHRDTSGMSPGQVDKEVEETVASGSARSTEALGGRADMLRANPSFHMGQTQHLEHNAKEMDRGVDPQTGQQHSPSPQHRDDHKPRDWTNNMVGNGVQETVKHGAQQAKEALKKMFNPAGAGSPVGSQADREATTGPNATPKTSTPGAFRRSTGEGQ